MPMFMVIKKHQALATQAVLYSIISYVVFIQGLMYCIEYIIEGVSSVSSAVNEL